jgi:DNA polymerase-3 subunit epsilon
VDTFLGLLILGALVWFFFFRDKGGGTSSPPPQGRPTTGVPAASYTGASRARQQSSAAAPRGEAHFAVIDLETSALRPKDGRIIEVGIVHLDPQGKVTHRWETLVNPGDGVAGRTDLHGIRAEWLAAAPSFEEVAGDMVERLRGRVLVAHNSKFDTGWLEAEFNHIAKPFGDYEALCTMEVARALGLPAKLSSAAAALGHRFNHHTAIEDAEAAGRIVAAALKAGMTGHEGGALDDQLPEGLTPSGKTVVRQEAAERVRPKAFLSGAMLLAEVTDEGHDGNDDAYLDVLERSLEDGYIDEDEQAELVGLASDLGLTHERALQLHGELIDALVEAALDDDTITADERREIEQAAAWLGVELDDWQARVTAARQRIKDGQAKFREEMFGKTIAFIGRGGHAKDIREALAAKHGIEAKTQLTKDTDIVAVGSADTDNKTTEGAAEQGLPVMLEYALWSKLGASTPEPPADPTATPGQKAEEPVGFHLADHQLPGVASGTYEGRQFHEWADAVRQLRREGRVQDAERILIGCIQATELDAMQRGYGVAPFYYEQLAILYSKAKRLGDELTVLERFASAPKSPGELPGKLADRLDKVRARTAARDSDARPWPDPLPDPW